jgi:uncharacterized protein
MTADERRRTDPSQPVRLRGHHLCCLVTYRGQGLTPEYARAVAEVRSRLEAGSARVVTGPDDVCASCPDLRDGICAHAPDSEAQVRTLDEAALALLGMSGGDVANYAEVLERFADVRDEWAATACEGCEWARFCAEEQR